MITAAMLAALAAIAVGSFVFAPHRRSKVGIVASGPRRPRPMTRVPLHRSVTAAPEAAPTAQPVASPDQLRSAELIGVPSRG